FSLLKIRLPPSSTLFPYTTLFRSLLPLTRACEDEDEPTLGREAGPFFKPNAPLKRDLFLDAPDGPPFTIAGYVVDDRCHPAPGRSEEHTSELQSRENLVCRLLLEK